MFNKIFRVIVTQERGGQRPTELLNTLCKDGLNYWKPERWKKHAWMARSGSPEFESRLHHGAWTSYLTCPTWKFSCLQSGDNSSYAGLLGASNGIMDGSLWHRVDIQQMVTIVALESIDSSGACLLSNYFICGVFLVWVSVQPTTSAIAFLCLSPQSKPRDLHCPV